METWHTRLQKALYARGLDWPDLFAHMSAEARLRKPSVYAWKPDANKRSTMMDADNAAIVCKLLKVSSLWLFHGKGESGLESSVETDKERISAIYDLLSPSRKLAAEQMLMGFVALEKSERDATLLAGQKSELARKA